MGLLSFFEQDIEVFEARKFVALPILIVKCIITVYLQLNLVSCGIFQLLRSNIIENWRLDTLINRSSKVGVETEQVLKHVFESVIYLITLKDFLKLLQVRQLFFL